MKKILVSVLVIMMVLGVGGVVMAESELPECAYEECSDEVRSEGDEYCRGDWCANEPEPEPKEVECAGTDCSDEVRSEGDEYCRGDWCQEWDRCYLCEKPFESLVEIYNTETEEVIAVCESCLDEHYYPCEGGCGVFTDLGPGLYCDECKEEEEEEKDEDDPVTDEPDEDEPKPVKDEDDVKEVIDEYIGTPTPPTGGGNNLIWIFGSAILLISGGVTACFIRKRKAENC